MMAIFLVRYAIGFTSARKLPTMSQAWFIDGASFILGLISGVFLARAIAIRHASSRKCGHA